MRQRPSEGWILAGTLDGVTAAPALLDKVAGTPHLLRLACEMALAGVTQITIVWSGTTAAPDPAELAAVAGDPRLATRASLTIASAAPAGADADPIMVTRADRLFHRDVPKQAIAAWEGTACRLGKVIGDEFDAVVVCDRATAQQLVAVARDAGGLARELTRLAGAGDVATAAVPYLGFTAAAPDRKALRRAERRLVWSLRKSADGIASKLINRRLSLPMSWLLARTRVHPNHITVTAFLCAVAGGVVLGGGGYAAGVAGMLLVNFGSIIDGVDGELARLKFQFSRLGQWLDTVADDLGNIAYISGVTLNLHAAGVGWAVPLGVIALVAHAATQGTQYFLIARVYKSGDLAAIPWAFQRSDFLSQRPTGVVAFVKATVPKLLKRDFALTMFTVFAILGRLELILLVFSAGALAFFGVFWVQFARNFKSIHAHRAAPAASVHPQAVVHAGD
jgi:phosphatidylglycerophosphate synthase